MHEDEYSNKVVLITGGTKGLGRVLVDRFLDAGAEVFTCARRAPDGPLRSGEREARFAPADVRDGEQVAAIVAQTVAAFGRLDVLVNNAGGSPAAAAADSSSSFNEKIVALNLLAPLAFAREAYNVMKDQDEGGSIVNISSISGMRANPMGVAYGAAKAGLLNATQTMALEWGPKVRVNAISAGPLLTDGAKEFFSDEDVARLSGALATKRIGRPDEIADAVMFVASQRAGFMTGSNMVVDGGPEWPQAGYPKP